MASDLTTQQIIASALRLPLVERERIYDAIQQSLVDETIDHGHEEPQDEVEAAWSDEIARRIAEIDSGKVQTIPAEEAERLIRGDVERSF
jgi:putative addiction module component (TIGR02574 family)